VSESFFVRSIISFVCKLTGDLAFNSVRIAFEVVAIADRVEIFVNFQEVRCDHSSAGGLLERRDGPVDIIPAQKSVRRV